MAQGCRKAVAACLAAGLMTVAMTHAAAAKFASLVIDAKTGAVLEEYNADGRNYPASLTKMMTLYLTFEALAEGRLHKSDRLPISAHAAAQAPSKLGLVPGQTIPVEEAILALTVKSANDVAVVLAEALGGSEPRFAQLMTEKARSLGMRATTFRNASGLPNPGQVTTARDLATLARALNRDYPQYYHYFSAREFAFGNLVIPTHNHVLVNYEGADGLKTGYIHASGFNLVTSAVRDGRRLIGVVLGGQTSAARDRTMMRLLDDAFAEPLREARAKVSPARPQLVAARAPAAVPAAAEPVASEPLPHLPAGAVAAALAAPEGTSEELASPESGLDSGAEGASEELTDSGWGIQIGAYGRYALAHSAALRVQHSTPSLGKTTISIGRFRAGSTMIYRARLVGLSAKQARSACSYIHRHKAACLVISPA